MVSGSVLVQTLWLCPVFVTMKDDSDGITFCISMCVYKQVCVCVYVCGATHVCVKLCLVSVARVCLCVQVLCVHVCVCVHTYESENNNICSWV